MTEFNERMRQEANKHLSGFSALVCVLTSPDLANIDFSTFRDSNIYDFMAKNQETLTRFQAMAVAEQISFWAIAEIGKFKRGLEQKT